MFRPYVDCVDCMEDLSQLQAPLDQLQCLLAVARNIYKTATEYSSMNNQSINQSTNQSINQSVKISIEKSINQSVGPSLHRSSQFSSIFSSLIKDPFQSRLLSFMYRVP